MAEGINIVLECQLNKFSINTTKATSGELLPPKHSYKYVGFLLKFINKHWRELGGDKSKNGIRLRPYGNCKLCGRNIFTIST
jgi:hypothetical protein